MTYATQADLVARFTEVELGQVADTDGSGEIDPALVARALADADAEIDAALAARYQLPLIVVPPLLVRIACDLARFSLYTDQVPQVVELRQKSAVRMLSEIAAGRVSLGLPTPPVAASSGNPVDYRSPSRIFGSDLEY